MTSSNSDLKKDIIRWRRYLHRHPELGNQEFKTSAFIQGELKKLQIPFRKVGTGLIAALGASSGRTVALRADMDALPIEEKTGLSFKSRHAGVMHACGHDAHVAMLLGAAQILSRQKLNGRVKLFFQPNEEGAGGALSLIRAGAMLNPKVEAVFGLHVNPRLKAGVVGIKPGPLMAAVDRFKIVVRGVGGHAAYPHEGRDPLPVAGELVLALQTIASRRTSPVDPVVVTVGTIEGGRRYNVIAETVTLTGTVRTLSETTHRAIPPMMDSICQGLARAHGVKVDLEYEVQASVLSNDAAMAALALSTAQSLAGKPKVEALETPTMGGEDFAEYLKKAPGCFIYIGTGSASKSALIPWHHPQFDLDESALPVGSQLLAQLAKNFLDLKK